MNNILFNSVLRADLSRTAAQRGLLSGQLSIFFVKVSEEALIACILTLNDAGTRDETSLRRSLHHRKLPCNKETDQIVIGASKTQKQSKTLLSS